MMIYSITLLLAGILITSIASFPTTIVANAQPQEAESANGGLTATLNDDSFTTDDTITISGSVAKREPGSLVTVEVTDPEGKTVEQAFCDVTSDNTFNHSFVAGDQQQEEEELDPHEPMITSGNYRMVVTYFPPPSPPSDESVMEQVEFIFGYNADWITVGDRSHVDAYDGDQTPTDGE
ncbi:MAG TPA: hypothetical protein VJ643_02075 [Nitrososphaera sp.]|nr:hypothetical protein [Nitrososphaera sp.]